ncbi:MAG: flagellar hook-length control protein FliK [Pseudobdellovibrio sp.]
MFEKMIGVSPPHKGEVHDSKLAESKELRGGSKSEYKKDFEKALQKKEANRKEDEPRTEAKGKKAQAEKNKSLGGTKKRVTENDEKIVSNVMASQESKVETPDLKKKELAEIEIDIPEKAKVTESTEQQTMAALAGLMPAQPIAAPLATPIVETAKAAAPQVMPSALSPSMNFQEEVQPSQTVAVSPEAALSAEVNFMSDPKTEGNKEILAKIAAFEGDKKPSNAKPNSFEQSVLSRLQNEQPVTAISLAGQGLSDQAQQGFEQKDPDQLKELKSDLLNVNHLHQSAGQSHSEFKAHIAGVNTQDTSLGKLEDNREANINDIMSQAQYLVKKGGGEVTVKMSPEGMGEVQLKVMLLDGKLNIEMQTQDKNVKKLIEESLSDLKSGLAAHRLSLEHVKVDTVNATNADNNMQFQSNLNHGGSEGRAQERWNDFQQNNQSSNKSAFSDVLGAPKVSTKESNREAPMASATRTYGGTKGATINRVA